MKASFLSSCACLALLFGALGAAPVPQPDKPIEFDAGTFARVNGAELIFIGELSGSRVVSTVVTKPPIYHTDLMFQKVERLRGPSLTRHQFRHIARRDAAPEYARDKPWVVAADCYDGRWVIRYLAPADEKLMALARKAASLPIGWSLEKGEPVSPWAALGGKDWLFDAKAKKIACSKCGRPALLVGDGIELTSEQVIPPNPGPNTNPFGDGQFRITVTNTTDRPLPVNALLTDGKTIAWDESLLVLHGDTPFLLAGTGKLKEARPVQLKSKESVSTVVDVLPLKGVRWPGASCRVHFQFCLGEKSTMNFFYHNWEYHDKLRPAGWKRDEEKDRP